MQGSALEMGKCKIAWILWNAGFMCTELSVR